MSQLYQGQTGSWEVVIGLEVHAQVVSNAKLFSRSSTKFGNTPNSNVSLVDGAFPGMLPVINEQCVAQAVKTGLALNCEINKMSAFDRKNYFYADLPQGYQISQFFYPIVGSGWVEVELEEGKSKKIGIEHMHLEQDAGKSIHDQHPTKSYIDLNRSGIALMEIVTDPDMRGSNEAIAFIKKLRTILRAIGSCDGNMEQGNMRADVNISVRRPDGPLGTRAEIKNMNSLRFINQAIDYEVNRQIELLESGGQVDQETRLFDPQKNETRVMRSKENAHDYRYFPDPDLPPLILDDGFINDIRESLPELPDERKIRFMKSYGLSSYDSEVLTSEVSYGNYYEKAVESLAKATEKATKTLSNWMLSELFGLLNKHSLELEQSPITPTKLAKLINLIIDGTISGKIAKEIFVHMWENKTDPAQIVEEKGLKQVSNVDEIAREIETVLSQNSDKVEQYRAGKDKLFGFFVGQVMKATGGKANPGLVNQILKEKLGS